MFHCNTPLNQVGHYGLQYFDRNTMKVIVNKHENSGGWYGSVSVCYCWNLDFWILDVIVSYIPYLFTGVVCRIFCLVFTVPTWCGACLLSSKCISSCCSEYKPWSTLRYSTEPSLATAIAMVNFGHQDRFFEFFLVELSSFCT